MLHTIIQKNSYMDSVELMILSKKIAGFEHVKKATVMMGTPANLEIMKKGGFGSEKLKKAKPNDMVIAVDTQDETILSKVIETVKTAGEGKKKTDQMQEEQLVKSWKAAKELGEDYNVCLISVPGEYAAEEAMTALEAGKHVLLFSDNVSLEEEKKLKTKAHEKGLLMMGPDCGTSILNGVPLAFANVVQRGCIGIVGAAGTGIQETSVEIMRMGGGISHAIGTGGRDISKEIGAITMKDAIAILEEDENTRVIALVSKPPAKEVKESLKKILYGLSKPSAVLFLGEKKEENKGQVHYAGTMEELAELAVKLSGKEPKRQEKEEGSRYPSMMQITKKNPKILGLFSGGTLAYEAAYQMEVAISGELYHGHEAGCLLEGKDCQIIDLGDDFYTKGKPHPMMDSEVRKQKLLEMVKEESRPLVILMDVVLGYGASQNPAAELAEGIKEVLQSGRMAVFVINLLGTSQDPQNLEHQRTILEEAGALVYEGNRQAVNQALRLAGYEPACTEVVPEQIPSERLVCETPSVAMEDLLKKQPGVINLGLKGFFKDLQEQKISVVHFEWKPIAGGDKRLRKALDFLEKYRFKQGDYQSIEEANEAVIEKVRESTPFLLDVVPAYSVTTVFEKKKLLLHAGPPMKWEEMTHPMQGSCVGAVLFEEWADTEEEAWRLLQSGAVEFLPCHHAGFVGPMGGITSPHMPVLKVKNTVGGNFAYCTMNEGIGQVLRFGAYSPAVISRLRFMRDVLGPVLSRALSGTKEGLNLNVIIGRAIAMGDEFHQRNIAASLVFLKETAPLICALDISKEEKQQVIQFLADTDQFFLNVMMAAAKSVMDYAATVTEGTVVTVMSRNGKDFGIRISGMKEEWFTGSVNTPKGLYFSGFSEEDGNPDMGDSAITETFGVGGMAMIAAPAVTRFVGSGGFYDALDTSNQMTEITIAHNGQFPIPTWNFQGICLGIDIRKVVATGITPIINTGIAHKVAGQGQIGAGTVTPPLECFSKALLAYAEKLGFEKA